MAESGSSRDLAVGGVRQRHGRGHAERDGVVGILDGEARRVGAASRGRPAATARAAAQRSCGRDPTTGARPSPRLARLAEPGLGQRDHRFLLAVMGEPRHRLADGDDLAGLGQRRGDHAVGVGLEFGIGELIAREVERALGALEPPFGLVLGGLLAIEVGDRRIAAPSQRGVALEIGGRLREIRGRGGELGLGALDLQLQVLRIEPRHHVAGVHAVADIDDAGDDLAGDAEAEIGLVARPHHADEFAAAVSWFSNATRCTLHRALGLGGGRGIGLAAGEQEQRGKSEREVVNAADEADMASLLRSRECDD